MPVAPTVVDLIVGFINDIGIPCRRQALTHDTFLPGIDIRDGCILYDPALMKYPGDLLHEAGHMAILLPGDRQHAQSPDKLFGDINKEAAEMAAIAWSWAALRHLQLPPDVVFHEHGYKGGSGSIIENFTAGRYIGVPVLHRLGMTTGANIATEGLAYPGMKHWVR